MNNIKIYFILEIRVISSLALNWFTLFVFLINFISGFINVKRHIHYLLNYQFYHIYVWCGQRDSNSHRLLHTPLKRARLPVPT